MSIQAEIEDAVWAAIMGEPMGPLLEGRARMAAQSVLRRHGIRGGRVNVRRAGRGLKIDVQLPPSAPTVQRIVVNVG